MRLTVTDTHQLSTGLPCGRFILKLATTPEEKASVFRLRYKVFNEELGEGIPENAATGLDHDAFDDHCDHLMLLIDGEVVGTYRLLFGPRRPAEGFYTQTEFDIDGLSLDWDRVVELGRGCISADYRKQTTLMTLFWGLHRYMMARKARYLMGCGSLPIMSNDDAEATFQQIAGMGRVNQTTPAAPRPANRFQGDAAKGTPALPPLIGFYMQFGANVFGRPAFDPVFKCHDLLIVLDMDHLSEWGNELLERFDKRLAEGND